MNRRGGRPWVVGGGWSRCGAGGALARRTSARAIRRPTAMQFDLTAAPPRVPQPTALVVNPQTGHIDFSLAGTPLPADCATQTAMTQAQCQFDQWLQTLDGFPSLSPASAPASAPLDPATLTLGTNVVVFGLPGTAPLTTGLTVGFDATSSSLTVTPPGPWTLGEFYWMGVRGYANGIRDAAGGEVVGSPTMALLKQDTSLTCDATDPDPDRSALSRVRGGRPGRPDAHPAAAAMQLFQLEAIRQAYIAGGGFDVMAAAGLPKEELAVLWGFPIHTNSVPLLAPRDGRRSARAGRQPDRGGRAGARRSGDGLGVRRARRTTGRWWSWTSPRRPPAISNAGFPPVARHVRRELGRHRHPGQRAVPRRAHASGSSSRTPSTRPTARRWSPRRCRCC